MRLGLEVLIIKLSQMKECKTTIFSIEQGVISIGTTIIIIGSNVNWY